MCEFPCWGSSLQGVFRVSMEDELTRPWTSGSAGAARVTATSGLGLLSPSRLWTRQKASLMSRSGSAAVASTMRRTCCGMPRMTGWLSTWQVSSGPWLLRGLWGQAVLSGEAPDAGLVPWCPGALVPWPGALCLWALAASALESCEGTLITATVSH